MRIRNFRSDSAIDLKKSKPTQPASASSFVQGPLGSASSISSRWDGSLALEPLVRNVLESTQSVTS